MKNSELDEKLTPAAKQALDELISDYRNRVLIGAKESASNLTGEAQEISVHDILASVNRNQTKRTSSLQRSMEMFFRLYVVLGLIIGSGGVLFFLYQGVFPTLGYEQRLALMLSFGGFMISAISYAFLKLRGSRAATLPDLQEMNESRKAGYSMLFIRRWQDIELAARSLVASRLGESSAKAPVSLLISKLRQDEILNADDEARLREFLTLRNKILHQGVEINREQFEQASKDADRILTKMVSGS